MIHKLKKYFSENTGFLIRLDDIAENMNWDLMEKATNLFDKLRKCAENGYNPHHALAGARRPPRPLLFSGREP